MKPNDGKCHLNDQGDYTYSTLQDYPSVSQVISQYGVEYVDATPIYLLD